MTRYKYSGPPASVTLRISEAETVDVALNPSADYIECPDHPHVARLVRKGFLTPVPPPADPVPTAVAVGRKRSATPE